MNRSITTMRLLLETKRPLVAAALLTALLKGAHAAEAWRVQPDLLGPPDMSGVRRPSMDISGIACSEPSGFPRHCIVIDDNSQAAQEVTLSDGGLEGGRDLPLIDDAREGKPLELDGEGVAFADGSFYVMGSHGIPRHPKSEHKTEARLAADSQIVRVQRVDGTLSVVSPPLSLTRAIAEQPELKAAGNPLSLADNGLTIEGIAVVGDRLFAGFRGPVLPMKQRDHAAILSVSLTGLMDGGPLDAHLFKLPLGVGIGIRDMAVNNGQLLLLAGPMADGPGRYAIYLWDGTTDVARQVCDLQKDAGIDPKWKAEALLVLDETPDTTRVLLIFDGQPNGAPTPVTFSRR